MARPFAVIKKRSVKSKMVAPEGFEFVKFDRKKKQLLYKKIQEKKE